MDGLDNMNGMDAHPNRFSVVLLVAALMAFGGCNGPSPARSGTSPAQVSTPIKLHLGADDAGKTMQLAKGDGVQVILNGNKTTGYTWVLQGGNEDVLKQEGAPSYVSPTTGVVGAGGQFTFTFKGVGAGKALLKFGYLRPWETNVAPVQSYEVTVEVK